MERTYAVSDEYLVPWGAGGRADGSAHGMPTTGTAGLRASGERTVELVATYYDTEDLRLARSRITLRRRTGGKDAGWHLKLPVGKDREEVQRPLGQGGVVPADLAGLARSRTRGATLGPVVELRTTRHLLVVSDEAGNQVEVADDRVTATRLGVGTASADAVAGPTVVRWREVEAELLGDSDPAVLDVVGDALLAAGAVPADWQSKLARALATTIGGGPAGRDPVGRDPVGRDPVCRAPAGGGSVEPIGAVVAVTGYVVAQVEAIAVQDPLVRLGRDDAVHAMRVATRRLRSALHTFGELFEPAATAGLEDELRQLAAVLGEVRDREVLHARFAAALGAQQAELLAGTTPDAVAHRLVPGRAAADRAVRAALDGPRHLALLDRLAALRAADAVSPLGAAAERSTLLGLADTTWRQLAKRMRRLRIDDGRLPNSASDIDLHRARKAAKRARYAGEALVGLAGEPAQEFVEAVKAVQQVLGDHQDSVAAREVLLAARHVGFPAGLLYRGEQVEAAASRAATPAVWRAAHRRRLRRWLG